jgi:hypothetical protein
LLFAVASSRRRITFNKLHHIMKTLEQEVLTTEQLRALKEKIRGPVITPHDDLYNESRKVFNGMIDRRPAVIVQCMDTTDVESAVNFARENKFPLAVRGGGHSGAGFGLCDDGVVIDLSLMRKVTVDPGSKTVRAQGGCLLGDIDQATHQHSLAVPCGINATTGIGGLTLGGGLGHLTRKFGLTIDNLLEAEVVLANGKRVVANKTENPELFWAIRGGGGNFGVVTSFLFQAHDLSTVIGGPMFWDMADIKMLMQWYRSYITNAPEDLNGFFAIHVIPPGPPFPEEYHSHTMCGIVWCHTGPAAAAEKAFDEIRKFKKPLIDMVGPVPVPGFQSMFDALFVPGMNWYWNADFFRELPDTVIDLHIEHGARMPNFNSAMHLYPINGKAGKVSKADTAWNNRDANWAMVIAGVEPEMKKRDAVASWAKAYWTALHPYGSGGAYVNFMMDEGQDRVKATYGDNVERLVAAKRKYDPDNLFRINQNIKP